jgi:hypothetical protein
MLPLVRDLSLAVSLQRLSLTCMTQGTTTITKGSQGDRCIQVLARMNLTPPLLRTSAYPHLVTTLTESLQIWGVASTTPHPLQKWGSTKSKFTQFHEPPAILEESK